MPRPRRAVPSDLLRAARRIRSWRHIVARRPLSPELWRLAVALARRFGVSAAAKALRLDSYALRRRAGRRSRRAPSFVEVVPAATGAPCMVELEDGRGGTMRVRVSDGSAIAHLEALARIFWGGRG